MATRRAQTRRKRQQYNQEEPQSEDPLATVRRLEAQLAQQNFFHEKTCAEQQHEIKTLQGKVKNLEKIKKTLQDKLDQNPNEEQEKLKREANTTNKLLKDTTKKLTAYQQQVEKLLRSNKGLKKAKDRAIDEMMGEIEDKNFKIRNLEDRINKLVKQGSTVQVPTANSYSGNKNCKLSGDIKLCNNHDDKKQEEEEQRYVRKNQQGISHTLEEKIQHDPSSYFPAMCEKSGEEHRNHAASTHRKEVRWGKDFQGYNDGQSKVHQGTRSEVSGKPLAGLGNTMETVNQYVNSDRVGHGEELITAPENQGHYRQDICHFFEAKTDCEDKNINSLKDEKDGREQTKEMNEENTARFLSTLVITHPDKGSNSKQDVSRLELPATNPAPGHDSSISFGAICFKGVRECKRLPPGLNFESREQLHCNSAIEESLKSPLQNSIDSGWKPAVQFTSERKMTPTTAR